MEEKKIVIDTNDKGQQAAFALGNGFGYQKGVRDVTKGASVIALASGLVLIAGVAAEPMIDSIKDKFKNFKEKRRLKKEQESKAKEEGAE